MVSLGKQVSNGFNKTFSKRNTRNFLGKASRVIGQADNLGNIVGGAALLAGQPELIPVAAGLKAVGAINKGAKGLMASKGKKKVQIM